MERIAFAVRNASNPNFMQKYVQPRHRRCTIQTPQPTSH
jgi:hypothetical protein